MKEVKREMMPISGGEIPVTLSVEDEVHVIAVNGVEWLITDNKTHASVLFKMMVEHLMEYMHYEMR